MTTDYRVNLEIFGGPLDLLLYLVRRNEIDILKLPIAEITAQFVEFLEVMEFIDVDLAGDFVVMASTLIEIKSRVVLPQPEEEETAADIEEESRGELVQQLLAYKKFKDAANALEERAADWQQRYPRLSDDRPTEGKDPSQDRIKEVELWDLVSALARVLKRKEVDQESLIRNDETPIAVYVERIGNRVRREGRVAFNSFFEQTTRRSTIVGLFLAILELLRHHSFRAEQSVDYGDIWVLPPLEDSAQDTSKAPAADDGE